MKRKILIPFLLVIMSIAMVFGVVACGGGSTSGDNGGGSSTSESGITINISATSVTLAVGDAYTITATASNGGTITWAIADTSIAQITADLNETAIFEGVGVGTTTLTATTGDCTVSCEITVTEGVTYTIYNGGTAVTSAEVVRGETLTLTVTASDGSTVSYWGTGNASIATVDGGVITGVGFGTTTIYAGKSSSKCTSITLTVTAEEGKTAYNLTEWDTDEDAENYETALTNPGTWYYWTEWSDATITTKEYYDGTLTLEFTNNTGGWYNIQLAYKNTKLTSGTAYALQFNVNTTKAGRITVNGMVFTLAVGDNTIWAPYYESADGTSASIQLGAQDAGAIDIDAATMVFSGFDWTTITAETLVAPSFTVTNNVISITDTNDAKKVSGYKLYLYDGSGDLAGSATVTNGMNLSNLDTSAVDKGTYTAYLVAIGLGDVYTNSPNSTTSTTITVTTDSSYDIASTEETAVVASPGTWGYNKQWWVTVSSCTYNKGTVSISFSNNAGYWYDTQLFYKNGTLTAGQNYKLTFTLTSTAAGTITVNGNVIEINEGSNTIELVYKEVSGSASISIQFGYNDYSSAGATDIHEATVTLSGFTWTETDEEPTAGGSTGSGATEETQDENGYTNMTNGGEGEAASGWKYWNDQNWCGSTVTIGSVKYIQNSDGSYTVTYSITGVSGSCDYGFQMFYNDLTNYTIGSSYTLTATVTSDVDTTITINGAVCTLTAGVAQNVSVTFEYSYNEYDTAGMSLLDLQQVVTNSMTANVTISNLTIK